MRTDIDSAAVRSRLPGQRVPCVAVADARPRHGQRACNAATYGAARSLRTTIVAWARELLARWRRPRVSPLERYLSKAVDHADLEQRMRCAHLFGAEAWGR